MAEVAAAAPAAIPAAATTARASMPSDGDPFARLIASLAVPTDEDEAEAAPRRSAGKDDEDTPPPLPSPASLTIAPALAALLVAPQPTTPPPSDPAGDAPPAVAAPAIPASADIGKGADQEARAEPDTAAPPPADMGLKSILAEMQRRAGAPDRAEAPISVHPGAGDEQTPPRLRKATDRGAPDRPALRLVEGLAPPAGIAPSHPHATGAITPDSLPDAGVVPASTDAPIAHHLALAHDGQWLDGIARDIAATGGADATLRFRLDPEHLGGLTVQIAQGADGASVHLSADGDLGRRTLIDAQPRLAAEARAQGLMLKETSVGTGAGGSGSQPQPQSQSQSWQQPQARAPWSLAPPAPRSGGSPAPERAAATSPSDRYA